MPEEEKEEKKNDWFLWLIGISCLSAIFVSFYFFYFKKDYDFIVEVACDPLKETCFQRDCSNPDDCPPNGLSDFKRFSLNAGDFKVCENEDCASVCETGTIKCEPIECAEDETLGESCSLLEASAVEE
ncbi:MAG: hypothetical protein WC671_03525 [Candidatus Paceibacterota bacterium]|jgi:hypothetical protein